MRKIKIVHFLYNLSNGGVESVLLNYFSNMDKGLFEPYVVVQGIPDGNCRQKFLDNGFRVIELKTKKKEPFKYYKAIKDIISKIQPDVVHCHMNGANFFPLWVAKKCGVKTRINHSHMIKARKSIFDRIKNRLSIRNSNVYMACGYDAGLFMYGPKFMKKVIILNNAIDYSQYKYDKKIRDRIRKELELEDCFVIGNVGRFVKQKNHAFIVKIFRAIKNKIPNAKLLLIGSGDLKEEIIQQLKKEKLYDDVLILSNRNDVNELLMAMDVFVFPSLFEGLPVAAIEAQATSLKCLLSDSITKHCAINNKTEFLPLDNISRWESGIIKYYKNQGDRDGSVNNDAYDIRKQSSILENIYTKSLR